MHRVVITGGRGLIGSYLSTLLAAEGWLVVHLTRGGKKNGRYQSFRWDPDSGYCDPDAFREGDAIIHLAAANIGDAGGPKPVSGILSIAAPYPGSSSIR